jgi:hypothetical protein
MAITRRPTVTVNWNGVAVFATFFARTARVRQKAFALGLSLGHRR